MEYQNAYVDSRGTFICTIDIFFKIEALKLGYQSLTKGITSILKEAGLSYQVYKSFKSRKAHPSSYYQVSKILNVSFEYLMSLPLNHDELIALKEANFEAPILSDSIDVRTDKEYQAFEIFDSLSKK